MRITTDEYFPAGLALEINATGTRIDRFAMFGAKVAVNHNVNLGGQYSAAHETRATLGAIGLNPQHIAEATGSASYLIAERQRQTALALGLPQDASMAMITAHMCERDVLVVEEPAEPTVILDARDHVLLRSTFQGRKVSELGEDYPSIPGERGSAAGRLSYLGEKLKVSPLATVMLYGYLTEQLPPPKQATYFHTNGQPGHELLAKDTVLPPDTDISLEGATLENAQLRQLYYQGSLIKVNPEVAPQQGERFTEQEMTVLGLLAIGLAPVDIARAMHGRNKGVVGSAQERLARRLGVTARIMAPQIIDRAFATGLFELEKPAANGSLSVGLAKYIHRVLPGELHNKIIATLARDDPLLPLILRKRAPTPAAAITYGHVYGLIPDRSDRLGGRAIPGGQVTTNQRGPLRAQDSSQFRFTGF